MHATTALYRRGAPTRRRQVSGGWAADAHRRFTLYTSAMDGDHDAEIEYYRSVEDFFASLRGVPHTLSPKDFELLRKWWRDRVPLAAVRAGIAEVFARRRDRGDADDVVSLRYCRHGVSRHAKRIAEMRVGELQGGTEADAREGEEPLHTISSELQRIADGCRQINRRLAEILTSVAAAVEDAAELSPAAAGEHLFALEASLLARCFDVLEPGRREQLEDRARALAEPAGATEEARQRAYRAHRDRLLREMLGLPRLEL